jgi:glutaredoxin
MIEIYGAKWCGYCRKAKALCETLGVEFEYHDVDAGNHKEQLFERMDTKPETIPQIFIDGQHLAGGYTGLVKHLEETD